MTAAEAVRSLPTVTSPLNMKRPRVMRCGGCGRRLVPMVTCPHILGADDQEDAA